MRQPLIALVFLAGLSCAASPPAAALGALADISIYDSSAGRVLPVYEQDGRYYVAGKPGDEYHVRVRNDSGDDLLAVISVDGVNAVSGADANWSQTGYVLNPGQFYAVQGWRTSSQRVAAFYFTTFRDSYATRTGRGGNVGVIGVALFHRKAPPAPPPAVIGGMLREYKAARAQERDEMAGAAADRRAPASAPASGVAQYDKSASMPLGLAAPLGTGYGSSQVSVVRHTQFERASSQPDEVIAIYYDSYEHLAARGIVPSPVQLAGPDPFPGAGRYVPPPPR